MFYTDDINDEDWLKSYPKVTGIFLQEWRLIEKLKDDIVIYSNSLSLTVNPPLREKSTTDILKDKIKFMWSQSLIDILLSMTNSDHAKSDMIQMCREYYFQNKKVLESIDEFEQNYSADKAIWWYTKDSFVYRLLNKAFRTQNIDVLYTLRFFIIDLYNQLKDKHKEYIQSLPHDQKIIRVYRGQRMSRNEFNHLKNNVGGLITMNSFVSATESVINAQIFAGTGTDRPRYESVIFHIDINRDLTTEPFAKITDISQFDDENECLISIGMAYKIVEIREEVASGFWWVHLESNIKLNEKLEQLLTEHERLKHPLLKFIAYLITMGEYSKAEKYLKLLIDEIKSAFGKDGFIYLHGKLLFPVPETYEVRVIGLHDDPTIFDRDHSDDWQPTYDKIYSNIDRLHILSEALFQRGLLSRLGHNPDAASCQYDDAYPIVETLDVSNIYRRALLYYHDGRAYVDIGDEHFAKICFSRFLKFDFTHLSPIELASYLSMKANISLICGNENDAVQNAEKALTVLYDARSTRTHLHAVIYEQLGEIHSSLRNYDTAEKHLNAALDIYHEILLPSHRCFSDIFLKFADINVRQQRYKEAQKYLKKALTIVQESVPVNCSRQTKVYSAIGDLYMKEGNHEQAMLNYRQALDIRRYSTSHSDEFINVQRAILRSRVNGFTITQEKSTKSYTILDDRDIWPLYYKIAHVSTEMGNNLEAIDNYEKALKILNKSFPDSYRNIYALYYNLGEIYFRLNQFRDALVNYRKGLETALKTIPADDVNHASVYKRIGQLYFELEDYTMALEFLERKAIPLYMIIGNSNTILWNLHNMVAATYAIKHNYVVAHAHSSTAFEYSLLEQPQHFPLIAGLLSNMATFKYKLGDFDGGWNDAQGALVLTMIFDPLNETRLLQIKSLQFHLKEWLRDRDDFLKVIQSIVQENPIATPICEQLCEIAGPAIHLCSSDQIYLIIFFVLVTYHFYNL